MQKNEDSLKLESGAIPLANQEMHPASRCPIARALFRQGQRGRDWENPEQERASSERSVAGKTLETATHNLPNTLRHRTIVEASV